MRKIEVVVLFVILPVLFCSFPALAQNIPPSSEPGSDASRFQTGSQMKKKAYNKDAKALVKISPYYCAAKMTK